MHGIAVIVDCRPARLFLDIVSLSERFKPGSLGFVTQHSSTSIPFRFIFQLKKSKQQKAAKGLEKAESFQQKEKKLNGFKIIKSAMTQKRQRYFLVAPASGTSMPFIS